MPVVYVVTNLINDCRYIGATRHSLESRRKRHYDDAKRGGYCRILCKALNKYPRDVFAWTEVARFETAEEAFSEEIRLIARMRPEYNITSGGQGMRGIVRTRESYERAAATMRGRKLSAKRKKQAVRGLAKARKMRHVSVVCLNDARFFRSIKIAALHYGITNDAVRNTCQRGQRVSHGLTFVLSKVRMTKKECSARLRATLSRPITLMAKRVPVVCLNDGREFSRASDAASFYGVGEGAVTYQCKTGGKMRNGLRFRWRDRPEVKRVYLSREERATRSGIKKLHLSTRKTVHCEDGRIFQSITAAADAVGLSVSSVSSAIHRSGRAGGLRFGFAPVS